MLHDILFLEFISRIFPYANVFINNKFYGVIIILMTTKPLIETNPYLKGPAKREMLIARSVRTSCGVEDIRAQQDEVVYPVSRKRSKKNYKLLKSRIKSKNFP